MKTSLLCTLTVVVAATASAANATLMSLYPKVVKQDNPVAYFRLDESAGSSTVIDEIGGRTGTVIGAVSLGVASGPLTHGGSTAANFLQSGAGRIDVAHDPAMNTPNFSVEIWARLAGGSSYRSPLTSRRVSPTGGYIFYANPTGQWEFWTGNGGGWNTILGPAANSDWTHLVGTFDSSTGTQRFYINGMPAGTDLSGVTMGLNNAQPLRLGGGATEGGGTFFFDGSLAEAAYYDYVLSPEQILAHFEAASLSIPVPEPSAALLVGLGMAVVAPWRRRRR